MTVTVKLDPLTEERLRLRAASTGRSTSDVIRAALHAYLAGAEADAAQQRSAFALGADLFGRHCGPADLAQHRKTELADAWAQRQAERGT